MTFLRRIFELLFLTLLRGWTLPRGLAVALLTIVIGLLARGKLLPQTILVLALALLGLLLGINLLLDLYIERAYRLGRLFLANVVLYLVILIYVVMD